MTPEELKAMNDSKTAQDGAKVSLMDKLRASTGSMVEQGTLRTARVATRKRIEPVEPTEEDLIKLEEQANLLASLVISYDNWKSRHKENFGDTYVSLGLTDESPVEGMTVAEIAQATLDDHTRFGNNVFLPVPDNNGLEREVKVISYNNTSNKLTCSTDGEKEIRITQATSRVTRRRKILTPESTEPAPVTANA